MTQTRRGIFKAAALGATALIGLMAGPALAAERLTGVYYIPQSYSDLSYGPNGFIERLQGSDAVEIDYYDSGKLLKADEQLPALRSGTVDFMFHTTSYITRSSPILGITGLPGVVEALHENPDRLKRGSPLFELINEELAEENLVMISMMGNILEPEYLWSTEAAPVRSIADIDGKKVRVVSFEATQVIEDFGGAAVRIPSSELYIALQRNTVDAAVANLGTVIGRSLQEQIDYVYELPLTAYGIGLFMDKRRWDDLEPEAKAEIEEAAAWLDENGTAEAANRIYPEEFWPMVEAEGIERITPDEAELARLDEAAQAVREAWIDEVGEAGPRAIALAMGEES